MKSKVRFLLGSISALALACAFAVPAGASTAATVNSSSPVTAVTRVNPGWNIPARAASQLNISPGYRDTHVHLLADIPWYEKNVPGFRIGSMGSEPTGFDSETCVLGSNPNATFTFQGQNEDAEAITGFGVYTDKTGANVTANIQVKSLNDGTAGDPTIAGTQDEWYMQWVYGGTTYFLSASYPGTSGNIDTSSGLPVDFSGGYVSTSPTGGSLYNGGVAATGSLDLSDGVIKITSSFAGLASAASGTAPKVGDKLTGMQSESDYLVGAAGTGSLQPGTTLKSQTATDFENGNAQPDCPYLAGSGGMGSGGSSGTTPAPHASGSTNLAHYGGPVAHHIHNYLIFWLPDPTQSATMSCPEPATQPQFYEPNNLTSGNTNYETILQNFFSQLSGSSYYNLDSQYADEFQGIISNDATFSGAWVDPCGYTSTSNGVTVPGGTQAAPVYDIDIQNEVERAIQQNGWPSGGLNNEYFVFTGYDTPSCMAPIDPSNPTGVACSVQGPDPVYCAYHGDFVPDPKTDTPTLYANMADGAFAGDPSGSTGLCYSSPINSGTEPTHNVNGTPTQDGFADAEVSITSHEMTETVTDAEVGTASIYGPSLGWYAGPNDAGTGTSNDGEIGDKCAYLYGDYNPNDGSNIILQGNDYIVQQEYSNWANGCALGGDDGTTAYAGATDSVGINQGWNLLGVTTSGIGTSNDLANDMSASGLSSVGEVASFTGGVWNISIPGYTTPQNLSRDEGVMVYNSGAAGTYKPSGSPYTSAPSAINFDQGWNLVAPTWPNPGVNTDSMYNELQEQNGNCSGTNEDPVCTQPVSDIAAMNSSGGYLDWSPSTPYSSTMTTCAGNSGMGTPCWFQTPGNSVPFTYGLWVHANQPLSWIPEGVECQSIDSKGECK